MLKVKPACLQLPAPQQHATLLITQLHSFLQQGLTKGPTVSLLKVSAGRKHKDPALRKLSQLPMIQRLFTFRHLSVQNTSPKLPDI